jgi:hypothetical protein
VRHPLIRAGLPSVLLILVFGPALAARAQGPPSKPPSELDAFMEKVLKRRDVNRQTLQQYILDDVETVEVLGPGQFPLYRGKREYSWYVRDGMHVRSPVRVNGVGVGEKERREYEDQWIRRERDRLAKPKKDEKDQKDQAAPAEPAVPETTPVTGETPIPTPRFVSEAYFMDFKFEPGNYYLAGREQIEGKDVLRIEYYPQHMFDDHDHKKEEKAHDRPEDKGEQKPKRERKQNDKEITLDQAIERKMNKTALVTLWVDPGEHQIVRYTFDNVWMDFLPGAWLVRVDNIRASMTMGQPFPGVWLPRHMTVHGGISLANGPFEATYARAFANYKLAEVKSKLKIPKGGDAPREPRSIQPWDEEEPHGPAVAEHEQAAPEVVNEIRVHGNVAVADEEVVRIAGLSVGQPLAADAVVEIERRLKASGHFETVEIRKRYRSLTDMHDVALILIVHEHPGVTSTPDGIRTIHRPMGRLTSRLMFLPILGYDDGYGFTFGGRVSTLDLLGGGEHLSVPLTWGGTRRAALELTRTFKRGPLTHVESSIAVEQRENPFYRIADRRVEGRARAERALARVVRLGTETSRSSIDFGAASDRLWTFGADAALDTRADPSFPRNAFYVSTGWTGLHFRSYAPTINRYTTDARGYVGLIGQSVAAARVLYTAADATLPAYERLLLGGSSTLRGFRTGTFDGDRLLATSAEIRVPITSVLNGARLGVSGFFDAATSYDFGTRLKDATWHRGLGGGVFLIAPLVRINLDIAHGLKDGETRLHLSTGFRF